MLAIIRSRAPRYLTLGLVASLFVAINTITRLGLLGLEADVHNLVPWRVLPIIVVGLLYDAAAVSYLLIPFALTALVLPDRPWGRKVHALIASVLVGASVFGMLFTAVAEGLFWNEFAARFNFIAVDYLVYTRETLGNIRQSFPVIPLLVGVAIATLSLFWAMRRSLWAAPSLAADPAKPAPSHKHASARACGLVPANRRFAPRGACNSVGSRAGRKWLLRIRPRVSQQRFGLSYVLHHHAGTRGSPGNARGIRGSALGQRLHGWCAPA